MEQCKKDDDLLELIPLEKCRYFDDEHSLKFTIYGKTDAAIAETVACFW